MSSRCRLLRRRDQCPGARALATLLSGPGSAVRRQGGAGLDPGSMQAGRGMGLLGEESGVQSPACSEVFDASLSCILADYLLGRAGERFILVRFDGQSPATARPEFFRELPMFRLPSQSLDFIKELRRGAGMGQRVSERWVASRAVSRSLRAIPQDSVNPGKLSSYSPTKTSTEAWV